VVDVRAVKGFADRDTWYRCHGYSSPVVLRVDKGNDNDHTSAASIISNYKILRLMMKANTQ